MKKNVKSRKPVLKSQRKKRVKESLTPEKQVLGLGPKIVNSIMIGLEENDTSHIRKIVEGLDEYDLAKLIEALDVDDRKKLIEIIGGHLDPSVFPELNEVVQEQVIESLDEKQIVNIVNELDSDDAVEIYVNSSGEVWVKQDGETDEVNVGQLELAAFPNEAGLEAMGNNLLLETEASGAPILDNPDTEGFGSVLQGYLETSNVNPVSEITELVSAQRAYEMNSKIISTSDQMLSTINQLK